MDGYCRFLREPVERYGPVTSTLQVTEEPNDTTNPVLDGSYPKVREAIVRGVSPAKQRAHELGHDDLRVGFDITPLFGPSASFMAELTALGGPDFIGRLDYGELDFSPDVFRSVAASDLASAVEGLLCHHGDAVVTPAGLGHLPLHITEHGWPTCDGRPPQRQAEVLDTVIRVVA